MPVTWYLIPWLSVSFYDCVGYDFRRPFVKRFTLCYRVVCLSCLSVPSMTLMYCSQTVGCINVPLVMEVGLDVVHIVLGGDAAPSPKWAQQPQIYDPCMLWPNGWMDQDATCYGGMPRPRPPCYMGTQFPQRGAAPNFRPHGWMDQDVTWYGSIRHVPGDIVLDGDLAPQRKATQHPHFSAHLYCSQTVAHLSNCWAVVVITALTGVPWVWPDKPKGG